METNKTIFKWLYPDKCWHEWEKVIRGFLFLEGCKCGATRTLQPENPQYDTDPKAFLELVEALRERGCDLEIWVKNDTWITRKYEVNLYPNSIATDAIAPFTVDADTLPVALSLAVLKLIDSEN